jgi:hypothetical protein
MDDDKPSALSDWFARNLVLVGLVALLLWFGLLWAIFGDVL